MKAPSENQRLLSIVKSLVKLGPFSWSSICLGPPSTMVLDLPLVWTEPTDEEQHEADADVRQHDAEPDVQV